MKSRALFLSLAVVFLSFNLGASAGWCDCAHADDRSVSTNHSCCPSKNASSDTKPVSFDDCCCYQVFEAQLYFPKIVNSGKYRLSWTDAVRDERGVERLFSARIYPLDVIPGLWVPHPPKYILNEVYRL